MKYMTQILFYCTVGKRIEFVETLPLAVMGSIQLNNTQSMTKAKVRNDIFLT